MVWSGVESGGVEQRRVERSGMERRDGESERERGTNIGIDEERARDT